MRHICRVDRHAPSLGAGTLTVVPAPFTSTDNPLAHTSHPQGAPVVATVSPSLPRSTRTASSHSGPGRHGGLGLSRFLNEQPVSASNCTTTHSFPQRAQPPTGPYVPLTGPYIKFAGRSTLRTARSPTLTKHQICCPRVPLVGPHVHAPDQTSNLLSARSTRRTARPHTGPNIKFVVHAFNS